MLGILAPTEAVLFIEQWRLKVFRPLNSPPFAIELSVLTHRESAQNAIERCFDKGTDFALTAYHHSQNAGHHAAHGNGAKFVEIQETAHRVAVFQSEYAAEVDTHQIIFLGAQIGRIGKAVVVG